MIKKILIVAVLVVTVSWGYTKFKPTKSTQSAVSSQVLGVSTSALNTVSKSAPAQSVGNIAHQVLDTSAHFASTIASGAANTVTNLAFDVATKPVIEKINSLPPEKKSEITNAICK